MRKTRKKHSIVIYLIILLGALGIGYAYLFLSLDINGTARLDPHSWKIHWTNLSIEEGSINQGVTEPLILDNNTTSLSFPVLSMDPGDYYEFTVDATNSGSLDAMVDSITKTVNGNEVPSYWVFNVTYDNGSPIEFHDILRAGAAETYRIRVEYDPSDENLLSSSQSFTFNFTVHYSQADKFAVSFDTVSKYYLNGQFKYGELLPQVTSYDVDEDNPPEFEQPFLIVDSRKGYLTQARIGFTYKGDYYDFLTNDYESSKAGLLQAFGSNYCESLMDDGAEKTWCVDADEKIFILLHFDTVVIYQHDVELECVLTGQYSNIYGFDAYCGEDITG